MRYQELLLLYFLMHQCRLRSQKQANELLSITAEECGWSCKAAEVGLMISDMMPTGSYKTSQLTLQSGAEH